VCWEGRQYHDCKTITVTRLTWPDSAQGAVRAVIAQRRLQVLLEQIQAGKLEPKSLIHTPDNGIRWAGTIDNSLVA